MSVMQETAQTPTPTETAPTLYRVVEGVDGRGQPVRGVELSLHPGQAAAWNASERIVAMIAGTQSGKTSFGPWWLLREIERRGPGDYLAVTATFDLFKLKMLPALLEVFEGVLGIGRLWAGAGVIELCEHAWDEASGSWAPLPGVFRAQRSGDPMWGRIIMRSAAAEGGLESATAQAAWLDEAGQDGFSLVAWEAVLRRLSLTRGRILVTTTPYNLGWLKQKVYDSWKAGDPNIRVVQFASVLNPRFPREEYEERRATLDGWKFRMFYQGQFERPAGLIYSAFVDAYAEEGGHKVRPFTIPGRWPRWVGVDPGGANYAKVWLAQDTDTGRLYLYRESLEGGKSTAEHAREADALARRRGENVVLYFVGQKAEAQVRLDWAAAGVPNVAGPPVADVESGIDAVIELFKSHRLFIFDTCVGVLDELGRYRRKLDEHGRPTDEIEDKASFHRLDALRYAVVGLTRGAAVAAGAAPKALREHRG